MTATSYLSPDAGMPAEPRCAAHRPTISVVSPFHNRRHWLAGYLARLEDQTLKDFEVIIVDDGSTDGLGDAVADARNKFSALLYTPRQ